MPTVSGSGTITPATVGATAYTLDSGATYPAFSAGGATGQYTTNHNFVLCVDTNAMLAGDTIELRIYTATLTAANERLAYYAIYSNVQAHPLKYSVPVPANISIKATLGQTTGTARAFPWSMLAVT